MTKVDPPPPPPPRDRIGQILHLPAHFDHFLEIKWCIYWPNLKAIHAFSRGLWPFKKIFFSTFLYILQFSNANNSLNKQDRNSSNSKILSYLVIRTLSVNLTQVSVSVWGNYISVWVQVESRSNSKLSLSLILSQVSVWVKSQSELSRVSVQVESQFQSKFSLSFESKFSQVSRVRVQVDYQVKSQSKSSFSCSLSLVSV